MGVDHGLGGKDNANSKRKREKKAAKTLKEALKKIKYVKGGKKEVKFDENARVEWLSGFRKRKQERRKFGLAMEIMKKNKLHKDGVKKLRGAAKLSQDESIAAATSVVEHASAAAADDDDDDDDAQPAVDTVTYGDAATVSMFGSEVSVVINAQDSIFDTEDSSLPCADGDNTSVGGSSYRGQKQPSKLEKALKIVKQNMNNGASASRKRSRNGFGSKAPLTMGNKTATSQELLRRAQQGKNGRGTRGSSVVETGGKSKRGKKR